MHRLAVVVARLGSFTLLAWGLSSGLAAAAPPVLTELTVAPATLEQRPGLQSVTMAIRVFDEEDDLKKIIVIARFNDGTKTKTVLKDDATGGDLIPNNGRFTGKLEIDTSVAQRISLEVKAKDTANQKTTVGAIVSIVDPTVTPMIRSIDVTPAILESRPGLQTITISMHVQDRNRDVNKVVLEQLTKPGHPERLRKIGTLLDDGIGADATADDGVYTIQTEVQTTVIGVIPLRVKSQGYRQT